jgi:ArsR family transcriptional regulator
MKELPVQPCCVPGSAPLPSGEAGRLASQFKALGDPTRIAILNRLAGSAEVCVCEFDSFGLSQPTISHHLRILREAGLVTSTRRGTWAYYRLVPEAVRELAFVLGGAPRLEVAATASGAGG